MSHYHLVDSLDALCEAHGWDYGVRLDIAGETAWSAEVRVTREPNNPTDVDRSEVWYSVGGFTAEDAATRALTAALSDLGGLIARGEKRASTALTVATMVATPTA